MSAVKQVLSLLFFLMSMQTITPYLAQDGMPRKGWHGSYHGPLSVFQCWATLNFFRETTMLKAFENVIKTNNENDLKIFKDKFNPKDCGNHPELVQKAIEYNRPDLVLFMHEKGLNIKGVYDEYCLGSSEQKTYSLQFPMHARIQEDGDKAVALLSVMIALGFDPQQKDVYGNTLQHEAAKNNAMKVLQDLKKNINANNANNDGKTALHVATLEKNKAAVHLLLTEGAKTNIQDNDRETPLHVAARIKPPSAGEALFDELLKAEDFNPYLSNVQGKRPLDLNDDQEECYCNPPQDGELLEPSELEARLQECLVIQGRKKKVVQRLDSDFIAQYAQKLKERNEEKEKKLKEEAGLVKQLREQEEIKAKEALEKKEKLEEQESELGQQQAEFQMTKNESLEKVRELLGQKNNNV